MEKLMEKSSTIDKLDSLVNDHLLELLGRIENAEAVCKLLYCFVEELDDFSKKERIEICGSLLAIKTILKDMSSFGDSVYGDLVEVSRKLEGVFYDT